MSPDLSQRGKSPLANAKAEASKEVMEKTQKTATKVISSTSTALTSSSSTRQELRALSQRLERMLRERREAINPNQPINNESSNTGSNNSRADYLELNIPR